MMSEVSKEKSLRKMCNQFPRRTDFGRLRNYLAAWGTVIGGPALKCIATIRCIGDAPLPADDWKIGILLGATHIGDVLYVTASLPILAQRFPRCKWYCVAEPAASEVLQGNPHLAGVLTVKSIKECTYANPAIKSQLENQRPDGAIIVQRYSYFKALWAAIRLGAPVRVGYVDKGFGCWVTQPIQPPRNRMPIAAYYAHIIHQFCGSTFSGGLVPAIYMGAVDIARAREFLVKTGVGVRRRYVVVFATARTMRANWPSESYKELIRLIEQEFGVDVLLCGARSDRELLNKINPLDGAVTVAAGDLSLRQLAAVLKGALFSFGPDSGPRHIANAMGTPTFYIPNLMESEVEMGVYCPLETPVISGYEFLSLQAAEDILANMKAISVISIIKKVLLDMISSCGKEGTMGCQHIEDTGVAE